MLSLPVACIIVFVVAYLLGSISWGLVISRVFYKVDLREHGSGKQGCNSVLIFHNPSFSPRCCPIRADGNSVLMVQHINYIL